MSQKRATRKKRKPQRLATEKDIYIFSHQMTKEETVERRHNINDAMKR